MPTRSSRLVGGRHELGQNFLADPRAAARIARLVPPGRVVELGPGDGAVTRHLVTRPDPITVVELDPRRVAALDRRYGDRVTVVHGDMLRFREPRHHHVVSNVPFGITTPLLRHRAGAGPTGGSSPTRSAVGGPVGGGRGTWTHPAG